MCIFVKEGTFILKSYLSQRIVTNVVYHKIGYRTNFHFIGDVKKKLVQNERGRSEKERVTKFLTNFQLYLKTRR